MAEIIQKVACFPIFFPVATYFLCFILTPQNSLYQPPLKLNFILLKKQNLNFLMADFGSWSGLKITNFCDPNNSGRGTCSNWAGWQWPRPFGSSSACATACGSRWAAPSNRATCCCRGERERTQSLTRRRVVCVAGGGHCDRQHDHHLGEGAGHRLQQTVHVVRHFHHDQKAGETKARRVQLP